MEQERRAVITTGSAYVGMGIIDRKYLPDPLFPPPPVVSEPPPTIDHMVAAAQSRLRVFINAECDWLGMHIRKEFTMAIMLQSLEHLVHMKEFRIRRGYDGFGISGLAVLSWQPSMDAAAYRVYSKRELLNLKEDQHD